MTSTEPDTLIKPQKVSKFFGTFQALSDINLEVKRGERTVVCGLSGSGKSTVIRSINRLQKHDQGHIIIAGTELTDEVKDIDAVRREVGLVFQSFNLFPPMTIVKNLKLVQRLVRKINKFGAREKAMHFHGCG
jgi:ABC-type polar amino acid transport system ATPase subunit